MSKSISITTNTSDDAMFGFSKTIYKRESIDRFTNLVLAAVEAKYQEYSVRIHEGNYGEKIVIDDDRDPVDDWQAIENDQEAIRDSISSVYVNGDWFVDCTYWELLGADAWEPDQETAEKAFESAKDGDRAWALWTKLDADGQREAAEEFATGWMASAPKPQSKLYNGAN